MRLSRLSRQCTLAFMMLMISRNLATADIFRWDTGALIPGSENLIAGPEFNFNGQALAYADFRSVDLHHARFVASALSKASFANTNLTHARFQAAQLLHANFDGADISGAGFPATTPLGFTREQLYATSSYLRRDLSRVDLSFNDLRQWDFAGQNLAATDFSQSQLAGTRFEDARVDGTNFSGTTDFGFTLDQLYSTQTYRIGDLRYANFSSNNLAGSQFVGFDLTQADFSSSGLTNSDFSRAQLVTTDFRSSTFTNAKLDGANMAGARLATASWVGANLDDAILSSVLITGSLNRATLRGANLSTSDLSGANLTNSVFDSSTLYDNWTVFPDGFDPVAHGLTYREALRGDYNGNGQIDPVDFDILRFKSAIREFRESSVERAFDLNRDGVPDAADRTKWIVDVARTWQGDANLDGLFDSRDLVLVFAAGRYELTRPFRAGWGSGDWSGDGYFDSTDLVAAFDDGGYGMGRRGVNEEVAVVPETSCFIGLLIFVFARRGLS